MARISTSSHVGIRLVAGSLFLCTLLTPSRTVAQQPDTCGAIVEAEAQYVEGRFDDVISTLAICLDRSDVTAIEAVAAYRLTALAYIRKGELDEARLAVVQLLSRAPGYEPDPIRDIPPYIALVTLVKELVQPEAWPRTLAGIDEPLQTADQQGERRSWLRAHRGWLIGGGSVVLAGIVTALVLGDGGETGPSALPLPPNLPR